MLNKEICVRCVCEHRRRDWTDAKERNWQKGQIWCMALGEKNRFSGKTCNVNILDDPPEECYYSLEQLVGGQNAFK